MLYVTTRSNLDAFTANRALTESRGPDGGLYLPFHQPAFSADDISALPGKPFNTCLAEVLNRLFNQKLTPWDVEFAVGRYPVRIRPVGQRILMGECWHNPDRDIRHMVRGLSVLLGNQEGKPSLWTEIALRIAIWFGLIADIQGKGLLKDADCVDISVVSGDFVSPISAWYARCWGLPIGNIVCSCNENCNVWDLIHQGVLRTDGVAVTTRTPEADVVVPQALEHLICGCGNSEEMGEYVEALRRGGSFFPSEQMQSRLSDRLYVSVIGERRMMETIPSVFATRRYLLSPYDALAYAGLLDYRAKTGENRLSLILSEKSPGRDLDTVAAAMGTTAEELAAYLENL